LSVTVLMVAGETSPPVEFVQGLLDIAGRDALGIQRDDLVLQLVGAGLVRVQEHGLKVTVPVARDLDRHIPRRGPQIPAPLAVATVARVAPVRRVRLVAELGSELSLQHLLERPGKEPGENALLAEEIVNARGGRYLLLDTLH
jgi:hypothetical protein